MPMKYGILLMGNTYWKWQGVTYMGRTSDTLPISERPDGSGSTDIAVEMAGCRKLD